jgi:hypothetical protein
VKIEHITFFSDKKPSKAEIGFTHNNYVEEVAARKK